jgi:hypothetical protein
LFVSAIKGPVGSGKSTACCIKIFSLACQQAPTGGVRKTRWLVLRNTYPELKSTTIKTWMEWFPVTVMRWDSPITGTIRVPLADKTTVEMEVLFLALDRPEDVGKLKSLEVTGAWINEAGEVAKGVFDMVTQRVGRFPAKRAGGATWSGVLLDTNPPDTDHWFYRIFEEERPADYEAFHQPPGLIEERGEYRENPTAENIENLPEGYYLRQVAGKSKEWIKVYLKGEYGVVIDGKPVYPEYNDDLHCKPLKEVDLPIVCGLDYGLTPAAVFGQLTPRGQLRIIAELTSENMGISQFADDILKPWIAIHAQGKAISFVGDPAGTKRADTDARTAFEILAEKGLAAIPAHSNDPTARREAVARYLTRLIDGQPGFVIDPSCTELRKGFLGGYCYKRIQTSGERYRDAPDKNRFSHPHDALQYLCMYANYAGDAWKPVKQPKLQLV